MSAKYHQDIKERLQIKLLKDIKVFNKKKIKSNNMVVNDTNISQKMKNKSLLRIEKIFLNEKKNIIIIIRKKLF